MSRSAQCTHLNTRASDLTRQSTAVDRPVVALALLVIVRLTAVVLCVILIVSSLLMLPSLGHLVLPLLSPCVVLPLLLALVVVEMPRQLAHEEANQSLLLPMPTRLLL